MSDKTVAFIPVRGGSKGIPRKNIKDLFGKPLIHWTESACLEATTIDKVIVATDDQEIADVARQLESPKLEIFWRGEESCTDTASTESAMLEYAESDVADFDHMVLVQATSPMLLAEEVDVAVAKYLKSDCDCLVGLYRKHAFVWELDEDGIGTPTNYVPLHRPRRQDFDGILIESGAVYVTKREILMETRCRIGGKVLGHVLPDSLSHDVDTLVDWEIVEALMKERAEAQNS